MERIFGGQDAIIRTTTNAFLSIENSTFRDNYSLGRGSVLFADRKKSEIEVRNSTFKGNYAVKGGVMYQHLDSSVSCILCTFERNFAEYGGVAYVNNEGKVSL